MAASARLREFEPWGPAIVGGTGGSGTRAVARILRRAGMYLGSDLNESEDAIEFGAYSDRWINVAAEVEQSEPDARVESAMLADLHRVLEGHLHALDTPRPWGWKEPRSAYLLAFFNRHLPSLKFLHVVRDGRDMALSENQNQLRKHGSVIGLPAPHLSPPAQSLMLWSWLNLRTARIGGAVLGERYMRIRFEDLCRDPVAIGVQILDFFDLSADPVDATAEVSLPATLGRWRSCKPETLKELEQVGREALVEFGYERASRAHEGAPARSLRA